MPLLIAIAIVVLGLLLFRGGFGSGSRIARAEAELLQLCFGDRPQMERLIAVQERAARRISRLEAVRRATRHLRRDQH